MGKIGERELGIGNMSEKEWKWNQLIGEILGDGRFFFTEIFVYGDVTKDGNADKILGSTSERDFSHQLVNTFLWHLRSSPQSLKIH